MMPHDFKNTKSAYGDRPASNATDVWAAENGVVPPEFYHEVKPFHIQQAEQIRLYKEAWRKAGHWREPRISVSRRLQCALPVRHNGTYCTGAGWR